MTDKAREKILKDYIFDCANKAWSYEERYHKLMEILPSIAVDFVEVCPECNGKEIFPKDSGWLLCDKCWGKGIIPKEAKDVPNTKAN